MKNTITTIRFTFYIQEYDVERTLDIKSSLLETVTNLEWRVSCSSIFASFDRVFIDKEPDEFIDSILLTIYKANRGFCKIRTTAVNLTLAPKVEAAHDKERFTSVFEPLLAEVGCVETPLFVVRMLRWGDQNDHSYLLGVYDDNEVAKQAGLDEETHRDDKYKLSIEPLILNKKPKYD